ncbi:molybdopterin-guanine dinucleotide biosynthesis protein B [Ideonella livida]|uniref:Molybdopterin-guanine dinucleotide biosynthesis protein B n=1 Tax=Ideonella livida TaxID=2707176 RepID=A0A7C9PG66_9BURK|nr:molybdopterin-guanine dinucleotide biosynthesis protein B [Ideonella livida]NDY90610.1 molybdopterin-guanine dinucleotide biosynthesis protein B [Ideonella livida]
MHVVGFCGASGAGKTTLIEGVIAALRAAGQRVSVIKHTHKDFEIDQPGKDSHRHREAGAFEVLLANPQRMALVRTLESPVEVDPHGLLAELAPCDWALVEGFRHADLLKIEVWRSVVDRPAAYPDDPFIVAVATDDPARLPVPTQRPVFSLDDAAGVAAYLLQQAARHRYQPELHRCARA